MFKAKQYDLPAIEGEGVAQKRIKKIDIAADKYVEIRDTRMDWTEKEAEAKANLLAIMIEHGVEKYHYGDQEVIIKPGNPNVKVKTIDSLSGEEEGEEED